MWEVIIRPRRHLGSLEDEMFIVDFPTHARDGAVIRALEVVEGKLQIVERVWKQGMDMQPAFVLHTQDMRDIAQAFLDVARNMDLKPHNESKLEGTVEAMSAHLADMRRLVFDEKKIA